MGLTAAGTLGCCWYCTDEEMALEWPIGAVKLARLRLTTNTAMSAISAIMAAIVTPATPPAPPTVLEEAAGASVITGEACGLGHVTISKTAHSRRADFRIQG